MTLDIPPLRERSGDIPLLVDHFLRQLGENRQVEDLISGSAMEMLKSYRWPGNVRELKNFVEATVAMGEAPPLHGQLDSEPLDAAFVGAVQRLLQLPYKDARARLLRDFEEKYLEALLERTNGNVAHAAREAKMARSYLNEMLRRHGLR